MRINTALMGAAAFAVGALTTATAQNVYSVNVVGYVNVTIPAGYSFVANPLKATDNSVNALFGAATTNGAALGGVVYTWAGSGFGVNGNDAYGAGWSNPNAQFPPGVGFFYYNPNPQFTNTFVGEVVQGPATNSLPTGYSMQGSQWPAQGFVQDLGLNAGQGDTIYLWGNNSFKVINLDAYGGGWTQPAPAGTVVDPVKGPQIGVGGGFFYFNTGAPFKWTSNFTVQ
jgi:hypothetical protein